MEEFTVDSVVRGHHVYKSVWTPYSGELLAVGVENGNEQDQYAVVVLKVSTWPHELQGFCTFSTW